MSKTIREITVVEEYHNRGYLDVEINNTFKYLVIGGDRLKTTVICVDNMIRKDIKPHFVRINPQFRDLQWILDHYDSYTKSPIFSTFNT